MKQAWINLSVAVGCVCLILSLLVPAILRAREDARRSQCKSHLKQLGLAVLNYHQVAKALPPAFWTHSGFGWRAIVQPKEWISDSSDSAYLATPLGDGRIGDWDRSEGLADAVRLSPLYIIDLCPSDPLNLHTVQAINPKNVGRLLRVHAKTAIRTSPTSERRPIAASNYIAVYGDQ
ncbi:MAG: DUF1559 domain-containing protein, partial [Planctomycetaceae bacterium]|nr:DUF1559 domain-containing protein [Planctomycetaceae bacterium]